MVAEVVFCGEPSSSTDNNGNGASAMAKAFAASTKLSETNYMVWYAGLLTVLLSVTIDPYAKIMQLLERIQHQLHKTMSDLEVSIGATFFSSDSDYKSKDLWKMLDKVLFNVVYWTVDESIPGLKSSLATTMMFKDP